MGCQKGVFHRDGGSGINGRRIIAAAFITAAGDLYGTAAPVGANGGRRIPRCGDGKVFGISGSAAGGLDTTGIICCGGDRGILHGNGSAAAIAENTVSVLGRGGDNCILNSHLGSIGSQQGGVHAVKVPLLGIGGSPCTFVHGDIRQGDDGAMDTQGVFVVYDGGIGFSGNGGVLRKRIGAGALIHLVTAAGHLLVVAGAALPHRLRIAGYLRALCKEQLIAAHGQQKNISFRKLIGRKLNFAFINSRFLQIQYHGFARIGHGAGYFGWFIALLPFAGYLSVGHLRRFDAALPFTGQLSIRHLGRFHVIRSLAGLLSIGFCRRVPIFLFLRRFQQRQSHTGAVQRGHPAIYTFRVCFFRSGGGFACC